LVAAGYLSDWRRHFRPNEFFVFIRVFAVSHIVGTVQTVTPVQTIGPDTGDPPDAPNTWNISFTHDLAPMGTKLLILHFVNAILPANNRVEVDLGYDTDVFTSADGADFWTRPVNVSAFADGKVPVRYITNGAANGSVQIDKYARGERHSGDQDPSALSNCDPFLASGDYDEPTTAEYDPFWFCHTPPIWENVECISPLTDIRKTTARSVGMVIHVDKSEHITPQIDILSTCSVTLVGADLVLTAGHCMADPLEDLKSASVTFDFQPLCDGSRPPAYNARFYKVKKVLRHRWDSGGDYCLFQIDAPPGGLGLPPITMRHDLPAVGEQIFGLHHPNGAAKKLSITSPGFETVNSSSANSIRVDFDVSGGSSGSGLFDTLGRVTGVLSAGSACNLGYFPTASILQQLATPEGAPITRDVMLVFDRSGSMSLDAGTGRSKIEEARDAASLFVQLVQADTGNRVGLVSFSTTASLPVDFSLSVVDAANKLTLIGPAPFAGGIVGGLSADGTTTIGGGLDAARLQLPAGVNPRSILLMTDGLQNTPPMIADVGGLGGIDINAIGFGAESSLDGALLTELAETHNGLYTRAGDGLALRKFFALAFGNIFASGALMDPEFELAANQPSGKPIRFNVCGEETITAVVGWDKPEASLYIEMTTPAGAVVTAASPAASSSTGRTWTFLRIKLPLGAERDGAWSVNVLRPVGGGEFPPPAPPLRYFVNVIANGGPTLKRWPFPVRLYTGDPINPMVQIAYAAGGYPENVRIRVTVTKPDAAAGSILSRERLRPPMEVGGDTIPAVQATLAALDAEAGSPVIGYTQSSFELLSSPATTGGAFEPHGLFGSPQSDLLTVEGNYTFHAVATYGAGCVSSREIQWSVRVDCGVDPARTDVTVTQTGPGPGGTLKGDIVIVPRDTYGNNLGPGRGGDITVTGQPGTVVTGNVRDNGDGSYTVHVTWDPGTEPGVVIGQPGRPPVVVGPSIPAKDPCWWWRILCLLLALLAVLLFLLWWFK
jgi:hypothetical protein